jgi:hypothetical protein
MINDPRLEHLTELMAEILATTAIAQAAKQHGMEVDHLDATLIDLNNAKSLCLEMLNERLKELSDES